MFSVYRKKLVLISKILDFQRYKCFFLENLFMHASIFISNQQFGYWIFITSFRPKMVLRQLLNLWFNTLWMSNKKPILTTFLWREYYLLDDLVTWIKTDAITHPRYRKAKNENLTLMTPPSICQITDRRHILKSNTSIYTKQKNHNIVERNSKEGGRDGNEAGGMKSSSK